MNKELVFTSNRGRLSTFKHRLFKVYLPITAVGVGLLLHLTVQKPTPVQAASPVTKITYSGVYSSADTAASQVHTAVASTPVCSPDSQFQSAGVFTPASGQTGLIKQIDPLYSHSVVGHTATQLADLSRKCPLVVAGVSQPYINAYTSYWIGWNYNYSQGADGLCRVSNPQVLLHIRQALPVWQPSAHDAAGLAAQWQAYVAAVNVHETGHVQLINQYSEDLLSKLQSYPAMDCGSISGSVDNTGQSYLSQLKQADNSYELSTQYGATQGAIVP